MIFSFYLFSCFSLAHWLSQSLKTAVISCIIDLLYDQSSEQRKGETDDVSQGATMSMGHGGALVESIAFNRRVMGSTPALAAM